MNGLIVISIPKSGTNFLSRYLAAITGWKHRWGRPSRDDLALQKEIPEQPDPEVMARAVHLVFTDKDLMAIPAQDRPAVFGNRKLVAIQRPAADVAAMQEAARKLTRNVIMAEHPVRSLPYFLRNPREVPIIEPAEVVREAAEHGYGVIFLYRELRDIVNSFAHFLHAGTRFVQFGSIEDSFDVVVNLYAPVLARAIRTWKQDFDGVKLTYEQLHTETSATMRGIADHFGLLTRTDSFIQSPDQFPTFTMRKGGSGDWRNHLSEAHQRQLEELYPDLTIEHAASPPSAA